MNAQDYIDIYSQKAAPYLNLFFREEIKKAAAVSPIAKGLVQTYARFMGGKNLRGALTYYSYQMFGGKNEKDILQISLLVQITHAFLLMHDDIMDEDALRRGAPTVHKQYEDLFKRLSSRSRKNAAHFGQSLAVDIGDLGPYFSNLVLLRTKFNPGIKLNFLELFSQTIIKTAYGQALDIFYESDPKLSLKKILKVHLYKTANYTITGPLEYGAVLAGLSPKSNRFKALTGYGTPVGLAFQLRDDELGMFADEETLGKSVDSDLKEGKNTLLFEKAFENASPKEVKFLKHAHGNPQIKPDEVLEVRRIIVDCGALSYSQDLSRKLVNRGKRFVNRITDDKKYRELLSLAADYVIERNH
ncbi:MAG: polyprenyl synthetase family protein [Patescibacteria group bacterium]|nr:polyprenyl synthetase family protein [Patescibacteria group bacterium]